MKKVSAVRTWMRMVLLAVWGCGMPMYIVDAQNVDAATVPRGNISGEVYDAETRAPLAGANVAVAGLARGAMCDAAGVFTITDIPVGVYTVKVSYIGYHTQGVPDVVVRSARATRLRVDLAPSALQAAEVVVQAGYFEQESDFAVSSLSLSAEEIRREAGTGGDISRIIASFPSIAKGNDTRNDLVVRGGSPIENAFYVDGIEVPNINHYPQFGASGGAIGIINIDAIADVDFSAGGFSPRYGDRLSSVMNISLREGGSEDVDMQADLHFMGAGVQAEGPLPARAGSWFISARRSWLDFLLSTFSDEVPTSIPVYGDVHAKLVWKPAEGHVVSLLDIFADDASFNNRDDAREAGENSYGRLNSTQNTAGAGWTWVWSAGGYSHTTLAHSSTRFNQWYNATTADTNIFRNTSAEGRTALRSTTVLRLSDRHGIEAGFDVVYTRSALDAVYGNTVVPSGNGGGLTGEHTQWRGGLHLQHTWKVFEALTLATGLRLDHSGANDETTLSPRLSLRWDVDAVTSLTAAAGMYAQTLPEILRAQQAANSSLPSARAVHWILGFSRLLSDDTRLLLEIYLKEYHNMPVDPAAPARFVLDDLAVNSDYFGAHGSLSRDGRARSYGIECSMQKKLVHGIYGTASVSWARSFGRAADGIWRPRVYDNVYSLALLGGWRLSRDWEISTRWILAGGSPYTPFDVQQSIAEGRGVPDADRIHSERLPAYHSLNLRADKRFFFERSTLTTFLAVWNLYGRKNVPFYRWNESSNRVEAPSLWSNSPLPVFGIEYEF